MIDPDDDDNHATAGASTHTSLPLVDVISSIPIDRAIFTTYTLSLAWFEGHLLRSLERCGANRIVLLADPAGVDSSLHEGLVSGAGVRYAVEPVTAPNGAFHAKIGLLWSRDSLVLAIGSGNLTFAGMHRNLEQWEVLTVGVAGAGALRQLSREVGEDLRRFLEYLGGRVETAGRAAMMLRDAVDAVSRWLPALPDGDGSVQWLDSTRESIGEQMVRRLGRRAGRRLQVLSPFHDRDGGAVHRLADELGASLEILYTGDSTTYPFGTGAAGPGVGAGRLEIGDTKRPLHAKVFHVIDADCAHVLSGSANATSRALWSTGNIEVSLLRRGRFGEVLPCTPSVPTYAPFAFPGTKPRPLAVAAAKVTGTHVRALLRWSDGAAPAEVSLGFVDVLDAPVRVPWPTDGVVHLPLPGWFDPLRPRALRIEASVTTGAEHAMARAWVAFDALLDASSEYRAALNALNRLVSGEAHDPDDDDAALLRLFGEEHARAMTALGEGWVPRSVARRSAGDPAADEDVSIPLRLIDAVSQSPLPGGVARATASGTAIDDVRRAMQAAFGLFGERASGVSDDSDEHDPDEPERPRTRPRLARSVRKALDGFEQAFVVTAERAERAPPHPELVLDYAVLCMRLVLRYRLIDSEHRDHFWTSADSLVRALLYPLSSRPPLLSLLRSPSAPLHHDAAGLLALLVALLMWRDGLAHAGHAMREGLREALALLDRATDGCAAPSALPIELEEACMATQDELAELLAEARKIACPSDTALALRRKLEAVRRGEVTPTRDDEEVVRAARRTEPLYVTPWVESCPRCHYSLAGAVRSKLLRRQPAECLNGRCARWLVPSEGA